MLFTSKWKMKEPAAQVVNKGFETFKEKNVSTSQKKFITRKLQYIIEINLIEISKRSNIAMFLFRF